MRDAFGIGRVARLLAGPRGIAWIAIGVAVLTVVWTSAAQPGGPRPLDAKSPITYFLAVENGQTGVRPGDRQLAQWALEAWQRSAPTRLRFDASPESSALVRLYWAEPSDGQYGEMRPLDVGGRRGAAVFIRPDMDALGEEIAERAKVDPLLRDTIVYLTCLHELGHALGLEHTRGFQDIMFFFGYGGDIVQYFGRYRTQLRTRADIAKVSGLSDADVNRIRALYMAE